MVKIQQESQIFSLWGQTENKNTKTYAHLSLLLGVLEMWGGQDIITSPQRGSQAARLHHACTSVSAHQSTEHVWAHEEPPEYHWEETS